MRIGLHIKATMSLTVITLNLVIWCVPLVGIALMKWMLPERAATLDKGLDAIYRMALAIDDLWLKRVVGVSWDEPRLPLARTRNVIVLSNHSSWADILLLQSVVAQNGPILKFLTKRELILIPVLGVIFWAFDFPMLRRTSRSGDTNEGHRERDYQAIRAACRVLRRRPAALVNFAEGTRFSPAQIRERPSHYGHLLDPKVGGFSALVDSLDDTDLQILDVTLMYPELPSFWGFLAGDISHIGVDAVTFDVGRIPQGRKARPGWLAERWAIKDQKIKDFRFRVTRLDR